MSTSPEPEAVAVGAGESQDPINEHQRLLRLLDVLDDGPWLVDELSFLDDLVGFLEGHFAFEEGPHGLREMIEDTPRLGPALDHVLSEHSALLATARQIRAQVSGCIEATHSLADKLRDHESRETELIQDSVNLDIGVGD